MYYNCYHESKICHQDYFVSVIRVKKITTAIIIAIQKIPPAAIVMQVKNYHHCYNHTKIYRHSIIITIKI